jgi:hypothetical protein
MAKKGNSSKLISVAFMCIFLLSTITSTIAESQTSTTLLLTGKIIYLPTVDVNVNPTQVIGTNHLSLGVMVDYEWKNWLDRSVTADLTQNADFKLIRLFDFRKTTPRLSPCTYWNENSKTGTWDWTYVDPVVQKIFEVGAEPLFCLGWARDNIQNYIPSGMAINPTTGLPYPDSWAAYCREWVKHFKQTGMPVRYYETTNEPWTYFGWDDQPELSYYIEMFNTAATAMRQENPNVCVSFDGTNRKPVLDYCIQNNIQLDFISFHKYDSFTIGSYSDEEMLNRAETYQVKTSLSYYGVQDARQLYYNANGVSIPVINSESNFNSVWETGTDPRIQQVLGSVWLSLMIRTGILEGLDYSIYFHFASSKSWETANKQSGGWGFGMINLDDNTPWYPYYTQKLIGNNLDKGDSLIYSTSSSSDIRIISWINNGTTKILVVSKIDEPIAVHFEGLQGTLSIQKIDETVSWENPQLQNQQIDATNSLRLKGYSIALIIVNN